MKKYIDIENRKFPQDLVMLKYRCSDCENEWFDNVKQLSEMQCCGRVKLATEKLREGTAVPFKTRYGDESGYFALRVGLRLR